jgi:hypothetical protein
MHSVDVSDEIGQALSRAAVMKALDSSFSTEGHIQAKQVADASSSVSGAGSAKANSNVIKVFQELIGDNSNRTEKFFSEQLKGKSIILENVKSQTEATKFLAKEKRYSGEASILLLFKRNRLMQAKAAYSKAVSVRDESERLAYN